MEAIRAQYLALWFTLLGITAITVVLRLYIRRYITGVKLRCDDYLIVLAWLFYAGLTVAMAYLLLKYDVERTSRWNEVDLSLDEIISVRKGWFICWYLFTTMLWIGKASIIIFYARIFWTWRKKLVIVTMATLFLSYIAIILGQLLQCAGDFPPGVNFVEAFWMPTGVYPNGLPSFGCYDDATRFVATLSGFFAANVLTNFLAMSIPLSMVVHLKIKPAQKIAVIAIFALALFITAIDIVRFVVMVIDPTELVNFLIWNPVESAVVILVANLPLLRPLLSRRPVTRNRNSISGSGLCSKLLRRTRQMESIPWSSVATVDSRAQIPDASPSNLRKV